jgi:hypothetical protein
VVDGEVRWDGRLGILGVLSILICTRTYPRILDDALKLRQMLGARGMRNVQLGWALNVNKVENGIWSYLN